MQVIMMKGEREENVKENRTTDTLKMRIETRQKLHLLFLRLGFPEHGDDITLNSEKDMSRECEQLPATIDRREFPALKPRW